MSGPKWRCSAADIAVPGGSFGCWREETPYFGNWPRYNQDQPSKRKLNLTWFDMIQLALSGFQPISATANGSIGSGESNFPAGNNMEPTSEWLILCHFYHPTIRFVDFPRLKKGVLSEHRVSSEMPLLYQCWSTFSLIFVVFAGVYPPLFQHIEFEPWQKEAWRPRSRVPATAMKVATCGGKQLRQAQAGITWCWWLLAHFGSQIPKGFPILGISYWHGWFGGTPILRTPQSNSLWNSPMVNGSQNTCKSM